MIPRLLPVLRLIRFSNAPTAAADIIAGFLLGTGASEALWTDFQPIGWIVLSLTIVSSVCLYSWGMVLNDLYDFEVDQANRSTRPLPSGEISVRQGRWIAGLLMMVAVLTMALAVGIVWRYVELELWQIAGPTMVFILLSLSIWLYDGPLKKTPLAPFVMGVCRGLNLILGATIPMSFVFGSIEAVPMDVWICSAAYAAFVSGLTWYARREEIGGVRWQLILGLALMLLGYGLLAFGPLLIETPLEIRLKLVKPTGIDWLWPIAIALVAFPVLRKAIVGLINPNPQTIKLAVIAALGNLVFIDGLICLYADFENWGFAAVTACLIIPIGFLKRFIPPT